MEPAKKKQAMSIESVCNKEKIPEDKIDMDMNFYTIEMDLKMFKNKFKKK